MPNFDFTITEEDIRTIEVGSGLTFDGQRSNILRSLETIDVQACPGSGKTTLIAVKLILLSQKWKSNRQGICVLSHTNVAKNEIIGRLQTSVFPEAQKLLSYPHFIGTIQEFIDKFVAIPFIRSRGVEVKKIDTDLCVRLIWSGIDDTAKNFVRKRKDDTGASSVFDVLKGLKLNLNGSTIEYSIPGFDKKSSSASYLSLSKTRSALLSDGIFFYSDMYVLAEKAILENPQCLQFIQERFPLVFIDEMQDTQGFQDDLLQKVFPLSATDVVVQRFGDPDQAIFNGMNGEEPNQSYNAKTREQFSFVIDASHRFDASICQKIRGISFNAVNLQSELSEDNIRERLILHARGGPFQHTIFMYDDSTIKQVMPSFISLLKSQFCAHHIAQHGLTAKVVGAVGKEVENPTDLRITSYWEGYKKSQSKHTFQENSFLEAVLYCRERSLEHWSKHYHQLHDCILKTLRQLERKDENNNWFSSTTLHLQLKTRNQFNQYRQLMYWFLNSTEPLMSQDWEDHTTSLMRLLDIKNRPAYFAFSEPSSTSANAQPLTCPSNIYVADELLLEVSTIHGVKGETHDATLVLETKNHQHDIQTVLAFLCADTGDYPLLRPATDSRKAKFMRQIYVAMSRSRYLLCFAIHKDRFQDQHRQSLSSLGWTFQYLNA